MNPLAWIGDAMAASVERHRGARRPLIPEQVDRNVAIGGPRPWVPDTIDRNYPSPWAKATPPPPRLP